MKKLIACAVAAFAFGAFAEDTQPREFVGVNGGKLLYRWAQAGDGANGEKYPLVIFFHGAGERGNDNKAQLVHGVTELVNYLKKTEKGFYLIAGQVPSGRRWVEKAWDDLRHEMPETPSESMALALELVDKTVRECNVDPNRVYATGISMGGYGTWDAISRRPELFAAAMPICGGGDVKQASKLADMPILVVHGDADTAVPCSRSRDMVSALWTVNGNVLYREHHGAGHNVWSRTYGDNSALAWFLSRRRANIVSVKEVNNMKKQAILCNLAEADSAKSLHPRFEKAIEFLKRPDLATLALGRYPLDGDNVYAMVQECDLKPAGAQQKAEYHRRYLDIQMPLSCEEVFGLPEMPAKEEGFNEEKDYALFDADCPLKTVKPGEFLIMAPGVAHAPCLTRGFRHKIRKVVIKVLY